MKSSLIKRFAIIALCTTFAGAIFLAEHLAWSFESDDRDRRQKPDEVIKALDLKAGQTIVDLGAGSGYFTWRFAKAVGPEGKAIALEIDSNLVEKLKSDASRKGLANYEARLVPTDDPQLAPGSVDVIFLCDTYHHINNRVQYFRKARQSLRQGGRLVILDMVRTQKNPDHSVVREEVIEELQQAGYRLTKEFDFLLPRQYFLTFEPVAISTDEHKAPRDFQHLRSIMA
ncbi:MAG TPA: methyltransferase domain-containing protein [Blastocatellia bacterium]